MQQIDELKSKLREVIKSVLNDTSKIKTTRDILRIKDTIKTMNDDKLKALYKEKITDSGFYYKMYQKEYYKKHKKGVEVIEQNI